MNNKKQIFNLCLLIIFLPFSISVKSQDIEMVTVNGGTFTMGYDLEKFDDDYKAFDKPHTVKVDTFMLSKYEITNVQYVTFLNKMIVDSNIHHYKGIINYDNDWTPYNNTKIKYIDGKFVADSGKENHPVAVTWHGAKAFCEYYGGRLPTEAEWEYAARGGHKAKPTIYAGSDSIDKVAWHLHNVGCILQKVGTKFPNELGIYDMTGNLNEWCHDWFSSDYYEYSPMNNPQGPSSGPSGRVVRGGDCCTPSIYCQIIARYSEYPSEERCGFRFCKDR
jgi:formylglycine-generating enzyme